MFPNEDKSRSKCPSPSPELQDRKGCQLTFGQADLQILNPSDRFPPASLHNISNGTKSLIAWVTQFWHHVTYLLENSFFLKLSNWTTVFFCYCLTFNSGLTSYSVGRTGENSKGNSAILLKKQVWCFHSAQNLFCRAAVVSMISSSLWLRIVSFPQV